jgi:serine/threonine protein kinase
MTVARTTHRTDRVPRSERYEFQDPIGTGGMGTVYRARDRKHDRPVAIKVLRVRLSQDPGVHERLAREFRAASELEHPNIVRALEFVADGEQSYLVYELVEAGSLAERVDTTGRIPADEALRIVAQVAQALDYAHRRQVIHRDVKPDNILLLPDGRAKLTDFGLAKDGSGRDVDLTRPCSALGTPNYMAPEQFEDAKKVDARSDVYSLAATLYSLLTREVPFDAPTPLAILAQKETVRLPALHGAVPGVTAAMEEAIRAALHPDAARRPPTCLEFFRLLTRSRTGHGVTATPAPLPSAHDSDVDRRLTTRYPLAVGGCAVIGASVHPGGEEDRWPLVVTDVSETGFCVRLARRFEKGAALAVEIAVRPDLPPRLIHVRVVRVREDRAGHWVHGCALDDPLPPEELKALLKMA